MSGLKEKREKATKKDRKKGDEDEQRRALHY